MKRKRCTTCLGFVSKCSSSPICEECSAEGSNSRRRRSIVLCRRCLTCLESRFQNDFQMCPCPNETMVDGGASSPRYGGVKLYLVEVIEYPSGTTWDLM